MNSKLASILYDEGIYKIPNRENKAAENAKVLHGKQDSVVLCLFIKDDFSHPTDEELVLAENIMSAVDISPGDYAWGYSKENIKKMDFRQSYVFLFHSGEHISQEDYPLNKWIKKENTLIIRTHSLIDLISDKQKKVGLWAKLKEFKEESNF